MVSLLPVEGSLFSVLKKYGVIPVELHYYAFLEVCDQVFPQSFVVYGKDEIRIEGGLHGIKTNVHNILNLQPQITRQIVIPSLFLSLNQDVIGPTSSPASTLPHYYIIIPTTSLKLTSISHKSNPHIKNIPSLPS